MSGPGTGDRRLPAALPPLDPSGTCNPPRLALPMHGILLRLPQAMADGLAIEAADCGMSRNALIVQKLERDAEAHQALRDVQWQANDIAVPEYDDASRWRHRLGGP